VHGYYIEISRGQADKAPTEYVRRQTLKAAERYITPELKEFEDKVLGARDRALAREKFLYEELLDRLHEVLGALQLAAAGLAELDVLACFAERAATLNLSQPEISNEACIDIQGGRHLVVEQVIDAPFIANDLELDGDQRLLVITGPNMSGKSTYLRQTALIVLMAQMGSFVPAESAQIGLVDRIFTRIGAQDEIHAGQSTFMVEMTETANILHHATPRSLVILDEVGRGTATFDGLSLAWAIVEYLHDRPEHAALVLFATHYHELTDLTKMLPRLANRSMAVKEWRGSILFLHRVVDGTADHSYGIHVARLAGVPDEVCSRAADILTNIERHELNVTGSPAMHSPAGAACDRLNQLDLFRSASNEIADRIGRLDLDSMTPMEALNLLSDLRNTIDGDV